MKGTGYANKKAIHKKTFCISTTVARISAKRSNVICKYPNNISLEFY